MQLHLAAKCDHCPFCFSESGFGADGPTVPLEILKRRAQMLQDYHAVRPLRHVNILGGEPLLYPGLGDFAEEFGDKLPLAVITIGPPQAGLDLSRVITHVKDWALTYDSDKLGPFLELAHQLLEAKRHIVTTFHFTDFESFSSVQEHFLEHALPRLGLSEEWGRNFTTYSRSWTAASYLATAYRPFLHSSAEGSAAEERQMVMRYTSYDTRFSRTNPRETQTSWVYPNRSYTCHLFTRTKAISIADDGRVFPCASVGQRTAHPVIRNIDTFGRLPIDLPEYLEECATALQQRKGDDICDLACKEMHWHLDP